MDEFELGGRKFKLNKINALVQFHIVRRIGPLIADLMSVMGTISTKKTDGLTEAEKLEEFAKIAEPVMKGLSRLSDADSEYVLFRLLSSVEVHQAQFSIWTKVANDSTIIMQDVEFPVLIQLAGRALIYNLKGFFSLLPHKASGQ